MLYQQIMDHITPFVSFIVILANQPIRLLVLLLHFCRHDKGLSPYLAQHSLRQRFHHLMLYFWYWQMNNHFGFIYPTPFKLISSNNLLTSFIRPQHLYKFHHCTMDVILFNRQLIYLKALMKAFFTIDLSSHQGRKLSLQANLVNGSTRRFLFV